MKRVLKMFSKEVKVEEVVDVEVVVEEVQRIERIGVDEDEVLENDEKNERSIREEVIDGGDEGQVPPMWFRIAATICVIVIITLFVLIGIGCL